MPDFEVTIHKNDGSMDSLNRFKKTFGARVNKALLEKFKNAKGAYVVQGPFKPKSLIKLESIVWRPKQNYKVNYLIVMKADSSSDLEGCIIISPRNHEGICIVENGRIVYPEVIDFIP